MISKLISGPELPVKMYNFPLVSTSQGIMAVGGYDTTNRRKKDEILHFKCQDGQDPNQCQWQEYPKKLDVARYDHVVIPLPASYETCNNWTSLWISNFTWPKNINWSKICKINIEVFYEKKKIPFFVQKIQFRKIEFDFYQPIFGGKIQIKKIMNLSKLNFWTKIRLFGLKIPICFHGFRWQSWSFILIYLVEKI